MKKIPLALLTVAVLIISSVPLSDADSGSVRLTGVLPTSDFEGVQITNYGSTINLKDYSVSDGEGTILFSQAIYLLSGQSVWILKSEPAEWFDGDSILLIGTNGISSKKFALNDKGDDVYLIKGTQKIDTFVYGNLEGDFEGWKGDNYDKLAKNSYASRTNYFDTDTKDDWSRHIPGATEFEDTDVCQNCLVTPFTFPESNGYPVFNELLSAEREVDISVYTISQPDVIGILVRLLNNGVVVKILCEGHPIGDPGDAELKALATLVKKGAEVKMICADDDGFKRYTYLHNKYCLIDGDTVIVTSENWVDSSFSGNRGWGAIIESEEYYWFMKEIFLNDFCYDNTDLKNFSELYPTVKSGSYVCEDSYPGEYESFVTDVKPILSPDNSEKELIGFLSSAEQRIYSEQLDTQYNWLTKDGNPLQIMREKAYLGVDARLVLDVTFDSPDDEETEDNWAVIDKLNQEGLVKAKKICGSYSVVHNKGIIVDDRIWLGSVNWTDNSMENNREVAIIFDSKEIAGFFAEFYMKDWGLDPEAIKIIVQRKGNGSGNETIVLDASESVVNPGSSFYWDLDNDGIFEKEGLIVITKVSPGKHKITVKMEDDDGNCVVDSIIIDIQEITKVSVQWKYLPLVLLCAIILIPYAYRKFRGKNAD